MKTSLIIILAFVLVGCNKSSQQSASLTTEQATTLALAAHKLVDDKLAAKAEVVLRAHLLSVDGEGKYARYRVQVLQVLKNELGVKFSNELSLGAYSVKDGLPMGGKFTLYLERNKNTNTELWMVVGASHNT